MARVAVTLAAFAAQAAGEVTVEILYGPYCPNSANYLSMYVQPFLAAAGGDVRMSFLPYALENHGMPPYCPRGFDGTPCGVLQAPLCALQPFAAQMPLPATVPGFKAAMNFAICDIIHANHGAPAMLTHTPADVDACAAQNQLNVGATDGCINSHQGPSPPYVAKVQELDRRLPSGKMAPWVFVNGQYVENTVPLRDSVCSKVPGLPLCMQPQGYYEVTPQVSAFAAAPSWIVGASSLVVLTALAFVVHRFGPGLAPRRSTAPTDVVRMLSVDVDDPEASLE